MNITPSVRSDSNRDRRRGSALVMVIFVLVLLTGMGAALLFTSQNEGKMSRTSLRVKEAFYLAESAIEPIRPSVVPACEHVAHSRADHNLAPLV